jgi:dihydrofolate synthase/folylpolyglutamate synthase
MGGRLDATNIVTPLASVITNIGLDHQRWLGETVEQIAFEKAGIIKTGVPVVTAATENAGLCVTRDMARQQQAALTVVSRDNAEELPLRSSLPLRGEFQKMNAAVAIATVRTLAARLPVPDEAIQQGFSQVRWAGRMHELFRGKQRMLLDGAHNVAGAEALAHELRTRYKDEQATLVFGVLDDKDWRGMLTLLMPVAKRLLLVPVQSSRSLDPKRVLSDDGDFTFPNNLSVYASLADALSAAEHDSFVVIAGSLYLVGEALELFQPMEGKVSERALNDWAPTR